MLAEPFNNYCVSSINTLILSVRKMRFRESVLLVKVTLLKISKLKFYSHPT